MTIAEGNILIDKFMESPLHEMVPPENIGYNTSYDYLMLVVEKIERLGYKTIIGGGDYWGNYINIMTGVSIINETLNNPSKFMGQANTKIEAIWLAVVEFIKWFNQL